MAEIALLNPSKETDNKLRWQADVEGVSFKLYIPKRRVPRPWPVRILVRVSDVLDTAQRQDRTPASTRKLGSSPLERSIGAILEKVSEHAETVRFAPRGDPKDWEIGEPYIPYSLLPSPSVKTLRIEVEWDRTAGTWSDD